MDTTTSAIAKQIAEARAYKDGYGGANDRMLAFADTLEAVTRERDNLLRRRDSDDLTINQVCAERAAVTKERDALLDRLDKVRDERTMPDSRCPHKALKEK